MKKTEFITQIRKSSEKMTKKQFLLLLNDISMEVPEYQREAFLEKVEAFRKKPVQAEEMAGHLEESRKRAVDKLDARIEKLVHVIEMAGSSLARRLLLWM